MEILLSLLPAFFFGPLGMTLVLVGGTVKQQLVGELSGALIVAIAIIPFMAQSTSFVYLLMAFGSGMLCAIGIAGQLYSFSLIGVSRTMPISTGLQLLYMAIAGVVIFNEWPTPFSVTLGTVAIVCIASGIYLTSYTQKERIPSHPHLSNDSIEASQGKNRSHREKISTSKGTSSFPDGLVHDHVGNEGHTPGEIKDTSHYDTAHGEDNVSHAFPALTNNQKKLLANPRMKALAVNLISALFLAGYIVWMRVVALEFGQFFPSQAAGMTTCALIIAAFWKDDSRIFCTRTLKLALGPGLLYGFAVLLLQVSTQVNGVATGFTLSQLGVIISVVTGIVVLKERKTKKEMWTTAIGVALILVGASLIGYTKSLIV